MKYRVTGVIKQPEVADNMVEAGLLAEYVEGFYRDRVYPGSRLEFKGPEGGLKMVAWLVPLLRDLGVQDVAVEAMQEVEWVQVDSAAVEA